MSDYASVFPTDQNDQHHWSGWPGAFCLKCHSEDPIEIALADNKIDFAPSDFEGEDIDHEPFFSKPEYQEEAKQANICPVKGVLIWDANYDRWVLKKPDGTTQTMYDFKQGQANVG
jgi:hypothetical protein